MSTNVLMRKIHRYLSWPFVALMMTNIIFMNFIGHTQTSKMIINSLNAVVTLGMVATGLYLYYVPKMNARKRKKREQVQSV